MDQDFGGRSNKDKYIFTADRLKSDNILQNEIIKGIIGIYKDKFLYLKDKKIPIYFKKKKITPPNGSYLKIHYAHLGYYKELQVVIYSQKDFEIYSKE